MRKSKSLVRAIRKMLAAKDKGKAGYAAADAIFAELLSELKVGDEVDLGHGDKLKIVDNFAEKNTVWKPAGVRRFDYVIEHVEAKD